MARGGGEVTVKDGVGAGGATRGWGSEYMHV